MNQSKLLASRLKEVFINGRWIANTNWKEQVENTNFLMAIKRVNGFNSMAMLTYHINYYLEGLIVVLRGGPLTISDKHSFEMPEMKVQRDWEDLVAKLVLNAEIFASEVDKFDEELLDAPFVKEEYGTYQRNIEAVLEHSYYHLGQLVLIKKLVEQTME